MAGGAKKRPADRTGASIRVEVHDADVLAALARVAAAGRDTAALMGDIAQHLLTSTQQRFETHVAPGGQPWARLAPRTARERVKLGYGATNILRRTTMLYASLTFVASAEAAEVGTNNPYAATHQFGATIKRAEREAVFRFAAKGAATSKKGKKVGSRLRFAREDTKAKSRHMRKIGAHTIRIPARPYLGISEADRGEIVRIADDWLAKSIGGAP